MKQHDHGPSKPVTFIIAFILGGTLLGPIVFAMSKSSALEIGDAFSFAGTMFSVLLGATVVWWRINVSTRQHIEAMTAQDRREARKFINDNRIALKHLLDKINVFRKCHRDSDKEGFKKLKFTDDDMALLFNVNERFGNELVKALKAYGKIYTDEEPSKEDLQALLDINNNVRLPLSDIVYSNNH